MAPACGVCKDAESKYKCPACFVRYCSLACFKVHKESCVPVERPSKRREPEGEGVAGPRSPRKDIDEDDMLSDEQRGRVAANAELAALVSGNKRLRAMLVELDGQAPSVDQWRRLVEGDGEFCEFVDKVLEVVGPVEGAAKAS